MAHPSQALGPACAKVPMAEVLVIAAGLAPEMVDRSEEALEAMGDVLKVCDQLLQETAAEGREARARECAGIVRAMDRARWALLSGDAYGERLGETKTHRAVSSEIERMIKTLPGSREGRGREGTAGAADNEGWPRV